MNEQQLNEIVKEVMNKIQNVNNTTKNSSIPVASSNRHVHLSQKDADILFGKSYIFNKLKDLSQPGQFAAKEQITLVGPKGIIEKVRILGPVRKETQIEISKTDSFKLGVKPPVRDSGSLDNTPGIIITGPKGAVKLDKGVILAKRHIHFHIDDALKFNVKDKQIVKVKKNGDRSLIFDEVLCRVNKAYKLEMHIDIDEANAADIKNKDMLEIIVE